MTQIKNDYQAARPSRLRRASRSMGTGDDAIRYDANTLAQQARFLEENSDLVDGALNILVSSIIGRGILIDPSAKLKNGKAATEFNQQLKALYKEWSKQPDISKDFSFSKIQRLAIRAFLRDGEVFSLLYEGNDYPHGTRFKLSLQLLERDHLSNETTHDGSIEQGVIKNGYGRAVAYRFYKDLKRREAVDITAENVLHLFFTNRLSQSRGISYLHSIINRCYDLDDIDESERVAARQGASIGMAIERTADYNDSSVLLNSNGQANRRPPIVNMYPGMVLDNLSVGEKVAMLSPNGRPNPNLIPFRETQLESIALALGISASSLKKKYTGSYSAERQAWQEAQRLIETLIDDVVEEFIRPIYERFVKHCILYGYIQLPAKIDVSTVTAAMYKYPRMLSIDPAKDAKSTIDRVQNGLASRSEEIRASGRDPDEVRQEIAMERQLDKDAGLDFTNVATTNTNASQYDNTNTPT